MTNDVSKFDKSKDTKELQPQNILYIFLQDLVLKLLISKDFNDWQLKNISLISVIKDVSKLFMFNDSNELHS